MFEGGWWHIVCVGFFFGIGFAVASAVLSFLGDMLKRAGQKSP